MRAGSWFVLSLLPTLGGVLGCASPAVHTRLPYPGVATPLASSLPARAAERPAPPNPSLAKPFTAATPAAVLAPNAFGNSPFAGEGPLLLEGAASDGQWVSVCQARKDSDGDGKRAPSFGPRGEARGDALERFLIAASEELPIEDLLSASDDGRYALVLQRGALLLWDNQSRQTLDLSQLGADARLSAESFAELRTAAFDASSEHLLYVRAGSTGPRVVLRDLQDGSERELDPGPGSIWRARFAPSGAFAVLEMVIEDSNGDGRLDFPAPLLTAPRACAARPGHFRTFGERGDHPTTVLLPLSGAAAIHEPDLLMPVGDALVLRDATGALLLERDGKKSVLEPAPCRGRIVHADAERGLFVIGCAQKKKTGRVSLELVTRGERKPLGIELASVELDREASGSPRLVALYPGTDTVLFDAERRELLPLHAADVVIATRAGRALVRRGNTLFMYDADSRSELLLRFTLDKFPDVLVTQPFAFVSPVLVNLESAQAVGVSRARPLALSRQGQLLLTEGDADSSGLVRGPLRWVIPSW